MNDPKPVIEWVGPSWDVARKFVAKNPNFSLQKGRLSGVPLLYRTCTPSECVGLSKGLTGTYNSNGKKIGALPAGDIKVAVDWSDVL